MDENINYKFHEDRILRELKAYVDSTYDEHYSRNKFQATEFIIDGGHGIGFTVGNILKYAQRYGKKNGYNRKDILKIIHYAIILLYIHDTDAHTKPISVTGSSANPNLAKSFGYQVSRYEGPTGILGIIQNFAQTRELDAISLWAALPHYAAGAPSPKATLALIEELSDFLQMEIPLGDLEDAAKAWEIAVTQLAEEDSEINEYVKQLEADKDDADFEETTGDALAKEFERYLKRQKDT